MTLKRPAFLTYLLLALTAFLPFEYIPTIDVAGYTLKLSYVASLILLAAVVVRHLKPLLAWLGSVAGIREGALAGLWLCGLAATLGGIHQPRNLVILALWGFMMVIYLVVRFLLNDANLRERVIVVLIGVATVTSLFGLYQFIGDALGLPMSATGLRLQYTHLALGFPRVQSVGLEPLYFSNFLLVPIFLVVARVLRPSDTRSKYWIGILIILLMALVLGVARGAYIALLVGSVVFLIRLIPLLSQNWLRQRVCITVGSAVVAIILSIGLIRLVSGADATNSFTDHVEVVSSKVTVSVPSRFETAEKALTFWKQRPLLGWGVASFGPLTAGSAESLAEFGYGIVNNEYVELLQEVGLLGCIAWMVFIGSTILTPQNILGAHEQGETSAWIQGEALRAGVVAMLVQYLFFSTLYIIVLWFSVALLQAVLDANRNRLEKSYHPVV